MGQLEQAYQKKERTTAVPAVYLFLLQDGKILLTRRANTGYQDGNWNVPSGHIEGSELPSEAAVRETFEEVGVAVTAENLDLVHLSYRPKHDHTGNRVDFFFRAVRWEGDPQNLEPEKCDAMGWFSISSLPENMTPHVREAINSFLDGIQFGQFSIEWLKKEGLYTL